MVLVGAPGSGKTTVGRALARSLNVKAKAYEVTPFGTGFLLVDPAGKLIHVNPSGAELLQRPQRELLGAELVAVLGAEPGNPLEAALRQLWQARTDRYSEERAALPGTHAAPHAEMAYLGG